MPRLHQLGNGNWIDLSTVTSIAKLERTECWPGGPIHPARVVVFAGQRCEVVPCDDEPQAEQMRDDIAALVEQERE